jgi:hypothetical protein
MAADTHPDLHAITGVEIVRDEPGKEIAGVHRLTAVMPRRDAAVRSAVCASTVRR